MGEFVSIIFCRRCGSRYVEIKEWNNKTAIIYCRACNNTAELTGFTMGRCRVSKKELETARNTSAGKNELMK